MFARSCSIDKGKLHFKLQKENLDDLVPSTLEPEDSNLTELRPDWFKNWEVDPRPCPKPIGGLHGQMWILAYIGAEEVIEKIFGPGWIFQLSPQQKDSPVNLDLVPTFFSAISKIIDRNSFLDKKLRLG